MNIIKKAEKFNRHARGKKSRLEIWSGTLVVKLDFDKLEDAAEAALKIVRSKSVEAVSIFDEDGKFQGGMDGEGG